MSDEAKDAALMLPENSRELVRRLMRKQAELSVKVALVFVLLLVGLPLFNLYLPFFADIQEYGFTLTWLFLGVLFFPITWALSAFFVTKSDALESEITNYEMSLRTPGTPSEGSPS
jgi:uncharacterized membrane protein (DUF485 family)